MPPSLALGNMPDMMPHQEQTMGIDFGPFLPSGVTLTGTPSLVLTTSSGRDTNPQSRLLWGPNIGSISTNQGGSGLADTAVIFQIGRPQTGASYVIDVYCDRSDGDVAEASVNFSCIAPR